LEEDGVKTFVQDYGMIIVDECHHASSISYEKVLKNIRAHTVYGLTATPIRKDGHQPITFMQCGPIRFTADAKSQIAKQSFDRYLIPRFTSYRSISDDKQTISSMYQSLSEDEVRNNLIIEDICKAVCAGRTPIVLTNRTSHVKILADKLSTKVANIITLLGSVSTKDKRDALQRLHTIPSNEQLVIVATGKYIGEGFDFPRLDTLFLALPISWKELVAQYAGRLHRENEGKMDVRVYDYIDIHEPICDIMYRKRLKGYASIGYRTIAKEVPSLFDTFNDIDLSVNEGQIFNGKSFLYPYKTAISSAKSSIVISSPKLFISERNVLVELLTESLHKGIEILIITTTKNEHTEQLQA
jgi:superfamily II DNA or RNA helicase